MIGESSELPRPAQCVGNTDRIASDIQPQRGVFSFRNNTVKKKVNEQTLIFRMIMEDITLKYKEAGLSDKIFKSPFVLVKLEKFVQKIWDVFLFQFGEMRLHVDDKTVKVRVDDLCDKFLLNRNTLKKAVYSGRTETVLDKRIQQLNAIRRGKKIIGATEEEWAVQVANFFHIGKHKNHSDIQIRVQLIPEQVEYYQALQKEIAKRVPLEWNRPSIELEMRSLNNQTKPERTCCILGGAGPLSDAKILQLALSKLSNEDCNRSRIVIYSSPPPMRGMHQLRKIFKFWRWQHRLEHFMSRWKEDKNAFYVIASNTAHIYYSRVNGLSGDKTLNLVDNIAGSIFSEQTKGKKACNVLVLGTTKAYNHKLYPKALRKHKVSFTTVLRAKQRTVQKAVEYTKRNQLDTPEGKQAIDDVKSVIRDAIDNAKKTRRPITHILLGCTELPLMLANEEKFLDSLGVNIVDTEEKIAEQIASNIKGKE